MKQMKKLAFLMIVTLAMASCEMFRVDVDTTMSGVLSIDVDETMTKSAAADYHFDAVKTINPKDDEEVEKYAEKIVEVGVGNVTAEVISVSKDDVLVLKDAVITIADNDNTTTWVLPEDWAMEVGNTFMLNDQGDFYDEVSAILDDVNEFTISMEGYSTVSGVNIELEFSIDATVTGSVF
ncbi:MAG: hypothetical protein GY790_20200 [Bacteroidetes bacterium]|nr:hypothetical protein [Bacteroidota bacterium]